MTNDQVTTGQIFERLGMVVRENGGPLPGASSHSRRSTHVLDQYASPGSRCCRRASASFGCRYHYLTTVALQRRRACQARHWAIRRVFQPRHPVRPGPADRRVLLPILPGISISPYAGSVGGRSPACGGNGRKRRPGQLGDDREKLLGDPRGLSGHHGTGIRHWDCGFFFFFFCPWPSKPPGRSRHPSSANLVTLWRPHHSWLDQGGDPCIHYAPGFDPFLSKSSHDRYCPASDEPTA